MECDALVIYSSRVSKKGKTYHHKTVIMRQSASFSPQTDMEMVEHFQKIEGLSWSIDRVEMCGGKVEAKVAAEDEPYYGGHSASLHVSYHCRKCKCLFYHPELPNEYTINDWLTARIDKLTGRPRGDHKRKSAAKVSKARDSAQAEGVTAVSAASTGNNTRVLTSHGRVA